MGFLPKTIYVKRQEWVPAAKRQVKEGARQRRARYPYQMQFLKKHMPAIHDHVVGCGSNVVVHRSEADGQYMVAGSKCRTYPWCISCTESAEYRRVYQARAAFEACTPKNKKMVLVHIVQTAPYGSPGQYVAGGDWGREASANVDGFKEVVWGALNELYPGDIGGLLSYQDFGERPFLKRHPHIDLTLNGWMLENRAPTKIRYFDLTGKGRDCWDATIQRHARLLAAKPEKGSLDIKYAKTMPQQVRVLRYQLRELVSLRNLYYDASTDKCAWWDYKSRAWIPIPVFDLKAGVEEYRLRLAQWPETDRWGKSVEYEEKDLHTYHGHMSPRRRQHTARRMGRDSDDHAGNCKCQECHNWRRLLATEIDGAYASVKYSVA